MYAGPSWEALIPQDNGSTVVIRTSSVPSVVTAVYMIGCSGVPVFRNVPPGEVNRHLSYTIYPEVGRARGGRGGRRRSARFTGRGRGRVGRQYGTGRGGRGRAGGQLGTGRARGRANALRSAGRGGGRVGRRRGRT